MRITTLKKVFLFSFLLLTLQLSFQTSFAQEEPKIEGSPFKEINYGTLRKTVTNEADREKIEKDAKKGPAPKLSGKPPVRRTRGDEPITAAGRTIYQFTNFDFPSTYNTCGQAAVATAVWNNGLKEVWKANAPGFAKALYNMAPPKITIPNLPPSGLGTDWHQVNFALDRYKNYGIQYNWQKGRSLLNSYIDGGKLCIIMIDMGVFGVSRWGTAHWIVAFARDANGYYVTNWDSNWNGRRNYITWSELNRAWGGVWNEGQLAKVHGTAEMFCVVQK